MNLIKICKTLIFLVTFLLGLSASAQAPTGTCTYMMQTGSGPSMTEAMEAYGMASATNNSTITSEFLCNAYCAKYSSGMLCTNDGPPNEVCARIWNCNWTADAGPGPGPVDACGGCTPPQTCNENAPVYACRPTSFTPQLQAFNELPSGSLKVTGRVASDACGSINVPAKTVETKELPLTFTQGSATITVKTIPFPGGSFTSIWYSRRELVGTEARCE